MKKTLTVVGGGRVGRELGRQLAGHGWRVLAVTTRSTKTARAAVRAIGEGRPHGRLGPEALEADLVLMTTPDDAIEPVARVLAGSSRGSLRGRVVLHTSGALGSEALRALARRGAAVASMHPMQAFGKGRRPRLRGVCFAIEGQPAARRLAARLAREMGGVPVFLRSGSKAAYHAGCSFASPQLLAVVEAATQLLVKRAGFRREQAVRALMPLAKQTLENFEHLGARGAWTGAVARGDQATIRRHLKELARWPAEYREAYVALVKLQKRLLGRKSGRA
jgi:predicted short-subunit dehydrogenase-like oxidoreductase (DUF2520 family)